MRATDGTAISAALALCLCVVASFAACGDAALCDGRRPVFSPDGKRLAFECERGGRLDVGIVPTDGGEAVWIGPESGNAAQPAWAPDGSLVFVCREDANTAFAALHAKSTEGGANLWRWRDGRTERIAGGRAFDYTPSVAPDGTIWFVTTRGEEK